MSEAMNAIEVKRSVRVGPVGPALVATRNNLLVGIDNELRVYSSTLSLVETLDFDDEVSCVGGDEEWLFAVCGKNAYFARRGEYGAGPIAPIPLPLWGDVSDSYCMHAGSIWMVLGGSTPTVCAFDPRKQVITFRHALNEMWRGGSFQLRQSTCGILVEVPIDRKLARVDDATMNWATLPQTGHVLTVSGDRFVSTAGDQTVIRRVLDGEVIGRADGAANAACGVRGQFCLFYKNEQRLLLDNGVAAMLEFPGRQNRHVYAAVSIGEQMIMELSDDSLVLCDLLENPV
jgi:hypothetical protein